MQEGVFMLGIFVVILSFFAAYGLVQMIAGGVFHLRTAKNKKPVCLHRVFGVKDAQDSVEGILRCMLLEDRPEEIIVLDFDSKDETVEILSRLRSIYPFLRVMYPEEYAEYILSLK